MQLTPTELQLLRFIRQHTIGYDPRSTVSLTEAANALNLDLNDDLLRSVNYLAAMKFIGVEDCTDPYHSKMFLTPIAETTLRQIQPDPKLEHASPQDFEAPRYKPSFRKIH